MHECLDYIRLKLLSFLTVGSILETWWATTLSWAETPKNKFDIVLYCYNFYIQLKNRTLNTKLPLFWWWGKSPGDVTSLGSIACVSISEVY